MSEKRRDNKNRILRNGESQRKDGRYMYKYIDNAGNVNHQLRTNYSRNLGRKMFSGHLICADRSEA